MCIGEMVTLSNLSTADSLALINGAFESLSAPLAALDPNQTWSWLLVTLQVAVGLGFVIFVHELGHFAVAKMCGVKCEKFMVGFDIGGYKLTKKWGETEYGIGILPLGGYVKMLGQDDNPANISEQLREAQASGADEGVETKEVIGPGGEKYLVDRRSYMAKSVPQRMAIISAGVIMNMIFAFIFAVVAYGLGVPYMPSVVSRTAPGSPAYEAGILPGDEIVKAGDIDYPSFSELSGEVTLGDMENGVDFVIRRGSEERVLQLKPRQFNGGIARIGVGPPFSLEVNKQMPVAPGSPADMETGGFEGGDHIVAVDGERVENYATYQAILAERPEKTLSYTVLRGARRAKSKPPADVDNGPTSREPTAELVGGETVEIEVPPKAYRTLGLKMAMGEVLAVQDGSPAMEYGVRPRDFIVDVSEANDVSLVDDAGPLAGWTPLTLPELLRRMAEEGREVRLKLRRDGAEVDGRPPTELLVVPLRQATWMEESMGPNEPVAVPALGVAYRVLNLISGVASESPAAQAGIESGDIVHKAEFLYSEEVEEQLAAPPLEFNPETGNSWPLLMTMLQTTPQGTRVKLTVKRGDELKTVELTPTPLPGFYDPNRGILFKPVQRTRIAKTFREQVSRGYEETARSLGMVYRFLTKLIDGQVPMTALGGPVTIAKAAGYSAFDGMGKLLVFLTMLSANLAVINFLPIPVLDGGHMVFLAYEGIRGRPASERFVLAMHAAGFVAIVSLMLFVLALDFNLIPRNL